MLSPSIYIIKTGDTFPDVKDTLGDFEDWIARGLDVDPQFMEVVDVPRGDALPRPRQMAGAVIAGSHAMVTEELDWSLAIEAWLPPLITGRIPLLGICYGHQLLAKAMGGESGYHHGGIEIGSNAIHPTPEARDDLLFAGLPTEFKGHTTHSQTVLTLPPGAVCLARNGFEPHHAFRLGDVAWGVQFHPEYSRDIMATYVEQMEELIRSQGKDYGAILNGVEETPLAHGILRRFGRLCLN
ncbi:MAG: glutamine amidotransferase [Desulfobacterales bacterium]|nr:glutamine amidotransferase [Desulfobacterales bacterium]